MLQTLLIVVAVLATVVGMVIIITFIWACIRWQKRKQNILHGHCCWQQHQHTPSHFDAYGFPPRREMIEMGCLRGCSAGMGRCWHASVSNNNTGVSRSLGLGRSYADEVVPAPPAPRSWTPSPPFDSRQVNVQARHNALKNIDNNVYQSRSHRQSPSVHEVHDNERTMHKKKTPEKKDTSSIGGCFKSQVSNKSHGTVASKDNFEDLDLNSSSDINSGVVNLCHSKRRAHFSIRKKNVVRKHSASNPERYLKHKAGVCRTKQSCTAYSDKFFKSGRVFTSDDHPAACSSYCISPSKVPQSVPGAEPNVNTRETSGGYLPPIILPSQHHFLQSSVQEDSSRNRSSFRRFENPDSLLPQIIEVSLSPACPDSASKKSIVLEEHQLESQPCNGHTRSVRARVSPSSLSSRQPKIVDESHGFCQSCRHHPHSEGLSKGFRMITRSTQTQWSPQDLPSDREGIQESTVDPTPSLSWDHLNPATSLNIVERAGGAEDLEFDVDELGELQGEEFVDEINLEDLGNGEPHPPHYNTEEEREEEGACGGW